VKSEVGGGRGSWGRTEDCYYFTHFYTTYGRAQWEQYESRHVSEAGGETEAVVTYEGVKKILIYLKANPAWF